MKTIANMTTAEILAEFNELTGSNLKRFSDRAAGEKRLAKARGESVTKAAESKPADPPAAPTEKPARVSRDAVRAATAMEKEAERADNERRKEEAARAIADKALKALKAGRCPVCDAGASSQVAAGEQGTAMGDNFTLCHSCDSVYDNTTGEVKKFRKSGNAAGVAASWKNPEIRRKRAERHSVIVDGQEYDSVRQAFRALKLPDSKHITFRIKLKEVGELAFPGKDGENHVFKVVAKNV